MPKVTALRSARPGHALVEVDGAAWRPIPLEVAARVGLAVGVELDRPRLRNLRRELRRHEALDEATRALRRRDRSSAQVAERLERRGIDASARREALTVLEQAGVVDDRRYACSRAEVLAGRGAGDALICWDLERDGVPSELVAEAVALLEPEPERARRIAAAASDPLRAARSLARKGFSEDSVEAVVTDFVAEPPAPAVRYDD